ncbi:MAG: Uncharacterised protein [Halieaceae bacterium]|nr:MAG: Uncharacterised protein [Halieaceae bacterium]
MNSSIELFSKIGSRLAVNSSNSECDVLLLRGWVKLSNSSAETSENVAEDRSVGSSKLIFADWISSNAEPINS